MYNDEHKEVRQAANIASVEYVKNIGGDSMKTFLPLFKKSIEDEKWRVRYEAYEALTTLAISLGN